MKTRFITFFSTMIFILSFLMPAAFAANSEQCGKPSNLDIKAWAYKAMMATYNYNSNHHTNYQLQTKLHAKHFYTADAWKRYHNIFHDPKMLNYLVKHKVDVSVGLDSSPVIIKSNNNSWDVRLTLILHNTSTNAIFDVPKNINLHIIRTNRNYPNCLQIAAMKMKYVKKES